MADVFISYARTGKAAGQCGGTPEIDAGQQFDDQIEAELRFTCALTVLKEHEAAIDALGPLRVDPRFRKMIADAEARLAAAGDRTASPASWRSFSALQARVCFLWK